MKREIRTAITARQTLRPGVIGAAVRQDLPLPLPLHRTTSSTRSTPPPGLLLLSLLVLGVLSDTSTSTPIP